MLRGLDGGDGPYSKLGGPIAGFGAALARFAEFSVPQTWPNVFLRYWVQLLYTISLDRKSTRLNSSHLGISYAVFCLKKKREDHPGRDHGARVLPRLAAPGHQGPRKNRRRGGPRDHQRADSRVFFFFNKQEAAGLYLFPPPGLLDV